jgi:hypothetical protein
VRSAPLSGGRYSAPVARRSGRCVLLLLDASNSGAGWDSGAGLSSGTDALSFDAGGFDGVCTTRVSACSGAVAVGKVVACWVSVGGVEVLCLRCLQVARAAPPALQVRQLVACRRLLRLMLRAGAEDGAGETPNSSTVTHTDVPSDFCAHSSTTMMRGNVRRSLSTLELDPAGDAVN